MFANRQYKTQNDDLITVAYVKCGRCKEITAVVIRREFMKTEAWCKYCGEPFTERSIDGRVRVETYSIERWKEEFGYGKGKV